MKDKVVVGTLNAYYGSMLTEHQREIVRLYCDCDMSLGEIGELFDISRQGVREILVRATDKLESWENKLGLVKKVQSIAGSLDIIIDGMDNISKEETKSRLKSLLSDIKEI